jgi:RNA polymerase sigma factor (TIGR02999 family)
MREKRGREIKDGTIGRFHGMEPISRAQVTALLQAWNQGDRTAEEKLWPIVYAELKSMAERQMRQERDSHTLQANALVHEVYLRLVDWKDAQWQSRAHFFGMCARMMRQILVDHARARNYQKRGGGALRVTEDDIATVSESKSGDMLALDDALTHLAVHYPRQSQVVELRFFGGLSVEEAALVLQVSPPTVVRDWGFARAWLSSYMKGELPAL